MGRDSGQGHRAEDEHVAHTRAREGEKTEKTKRTERKTEGSCYKGCVGKKQRPGREAPLLMPIVAPPGDSFPHAFPTPELRGVSRGFPLHLSSMWLSRHPSSTWLWAVFPILACDRIRRAIIRQSTPQVLHPCVVAGLNCAQIITGRSRRSKVGAVVDTSASAGSA